MALYLCNMVLKLGYDGSIPLSPNQTYFIKEIINVYEVEVFENNREDKMTFLSFLSSYPASCNVSFQVFPLRSAVENFVALLEDRLDLIDYAQQIPEEYFTDMYVEAIGSNELLAVIGPGSMTSQIDPFLLLKPFQLNTWIGLTAVILLTSLMEYKFGARARLWPVLQLVNFLIIMYPSNLRALVSRSDIVSPVFNGTLVGLTEKMKSGEAFVPKTNDIEGYGYTYWFLRNNVSPDRFDAFIKAYSAQSNLEKPKDQDFEEYAMYVFSNMRGLVLLINPEELASETFSKESESSESPLVNGKLINLHFPYVPNFYAFPKTEVGKALAKHTSSMSEFVRALVGRRKAKFHRMFREKRREFREEKRKDVIFWRHLVPAAVILESGLIIASLSFTLEYFL